MNGGPSVAVFFAAVHFHFIVFRDVDHARGQLSIGIFVRCLSFLIKSNKDRDDVYIVHVL